ncbi:ATP-binding protein [Mucilaginibacter sp.]|uniref:AlbA family DNA-binding domain-containing protein n=1 Tax=Mucilaginibacter sp. TaxID=1882438 RepID=UPI0032666FD7
MDFSSSYFGQALDKLSFDDIVAYFAEPRTENATIEFKSYSDRLSFDDSLQKIIRGISSFLNSNGGILIWGAPRASKIEGYSEDVFYGELCAAPQSKGKDSLMNRIGSAITPLPTGVAVKILSSEKRHVYVFEIQESKSKPHQFDYRYYIRLDGQTVPAPHYLVDALMKQQSFPDLGGLLSFGQSRESISGDLLPKVILPVSVFIVNNSEFQNELNVSFRLQCVGGFFSRSRGIIPHLGPASYTKGGTELVHSSFASVLHFGIPQQYTDEVTIIFDKKDGAFKNVRLLLSFGGQHSPAKISTYDVGVGINGDKCDVVSLSENIMFSDTTIELSKISPK